MLAIQSLRLPRSSEAQLPLRFVDPQNHAHNEGFWTLVGRQLQRVCKQINGSSGNSGTVCTRRYDPLQVEMRRSPRVREPSSFLGPS